MEKSKRPNIVLILLDDMGFADTSTFGGMVKTPELDRLAIGGLRYINFNTAGVCSQTRAALLSGRNHHRVGFGAQPLTAKDSPGYNCRWPKSAAAIPAVLRESGYATAAFGKWHNTPYEEIHPFGPFDRWPTGLGFDYFYGFQEAQENQWEPCGLYRNTFPIEIVEVPGRTFHLTSDIVDEAIRWVHTHESVGGDRPYFLYLATGAVHSPHQAPRRWIEEYRSVFDVGWDELNRQIFSRQKSLGVIPKMAELTPRPMQIPAWESLSAQRKKLYTKQMEVYAGFIAHTDHEIGRLMRAVQAHPGGEDTLILYIVGDNGSAGEGGLDGITDALTTVEDQLERVGDLGSHRIAINLYSTGWAWMGSTPFKWWKAVASHFGGVRDPLVISWPARIRDRGGVRNQFTHVNDVAATIYAATGIVPPEFMSGVRQQPFDGVSFAHTFDDPCASSWHRTQYFEAYGNRAIYDKGWMAAAVHRVPPFESLEREYDDDAWELYYVDRDFSQAHDLASEYPDKLQELRRLFDSEAKKNNVYPLGDGAAGKGYWFHPWLSGGQNRQYVFHAGLPRLQFGGIPALSSASYRISARVVTPDSGAEGVIVSYGGRAGGFALYVINERLVYENNLGNARHEFISAGVSMPRGAADIAFEVCTKGDLQQSSNAPWSLRGAIVIGRLFINSKLVGEGAITTAGRTVWWESFGVGRSYGSPVSEVYRGPFQFTGTLVSVKLEAIGSLWPDSGEQRIREGSQ